MEQPQVQDHHIATAASPKRKWALFALVPTVLAVLLANLGPIVSGDLWWHLRTGKWILAEGRLPTIDPFSHTAGSTPWVLQEYGSQVLLALVHSAAGFPGIKLFATLVSLAVLAVVWRRARRELDQPWAALFTCLFALLFALKWELRPHLFSLLLFFWLENNLFGRNKHPKGPSLETPNLRRCLELFILSTIWVQLHAEALFAPILVLAIVTGAALTSTREGAGAKHTLAWCAMFLCALVGTMASPLFLAPHHYALFGRGVPQDFIEEWFRPWVLPGDPRFAPVTIPVFATYCATLLLGGLFALRTLVRKLSRTPNEISWERLAFLAGCLLFALSARRFFWLAWFPLLDAVSLSLSGRASLRRLVIPPALGAALLGLLLFPTHYPASAARSLRNGEYGSLVDHSLFPVGAAHFAAEAGLAGNLYNPYEWGGYLGWVLGDAAPVFIDARTVLFEDVILERWQAERDAAIRAQVFQDRNVDLVVFKHFVYHGKGALSWTPNSPSTGEAANESWIRVWTDEIAVVWVRRDSENARRAASFWGSDGVVMNTADGITEAAINLVHPSDLTELRILPAEVIAKLREAESLSDSKGANNQPRAMLERAAVWNELRMKRNVRDELRGLERFLGEHDKPNRPVWEALIKAALLSKDQVELADLIGKLKADFIQIDILEFQGAE